MHRGTFHKWFAVGCRYLQLRARGYKTFFMLNSVEHEIFPLIDVKMPTIVGILTCMIGKNNILGLTEP